MPLQRLPVWIQVSSFLLAFNAGMINLLGLLHTAHQATTHMTGNVSMLAIAVWEEDWHRLLFLLGVLFCFVLGSFYSGFIIRDSKLRLGRRYGSVLSLEALFLFIGWELINHYPHYALLWMAAAAGMQNALATTYNSTIIRTTHLSGVLTDIGLALGHRARGLYVDPKRILLHMLIVSGFFLGGLISVLAYQQLHIHAFLLPVLLTTTLSLSYWWYYWLSHRTSAE